MPQTYYSRQPLLQPYVEFWEEQQHFQGCFLSCSKKRMAGMTAV